VPSEPRRPVPFNQIQRPLDRALHTPQFSGCDHAVLEEARELSYAEAKRRGLPDPLPFRLEQSKLARRHQIAQETVNRAVARLKKSRVLMETPEGLLINKQYRTWTGHHALNVTQVEHCEEGWGAMTKTSQAGDAPMTKKSSTYDEKVTAPMTKKSSTYDEKVIETRVPPRTPLYGKRLETVETETAHAREAVREEGEEEDEFADVKREMKKLREQRANAKARAGSRRNGTAD
jgi:hypothetical protein